MGDQSMEMIIMELVVGGGEARSLAMEAIRSARKGDFGAADELLRRCDDVLLKTHQIQTGLIQKEAAGEHISVQLLMVHAQDHIMNAMTVRDLAGELVEIMGDVRMKDAKELTGGTTE